MREDAFNLTDNYYPFADPQRIAEDNGWKLVLPEPNQLLIDLDSEEAYDEFIKKYRGFCSKGLWWDVKMEIKESKSGLPNRHVTLTFEEDRVFSDAERIALQAALGDDPVRIFLSGVRMEHGFRPAVTFFELDDEPL